MEIMEPAEDNYVRLEFVVPTRGLIGYRSNFITNTQGEGIMVRSFEDALMPDATVFRRNP